MSVDFVERQPVATFVSETLDDHGVNRPKRHSCASNPVINRGGADVEL
jgi:hypothetical protein